MRRSPQRMVWIPLAIVLALPACGGNDSPAPGVVDPGLFVLRSFGYKWLLTPHRFNKTAVSIPNSGVLLAEPELVFQGGTFSTGEEGTDYSTISLGYSAFHSDKVQFQTGQSPTIEGWGTSNGCTRGEPAEAEMRLSVPLPDFDPAVTTGIVFLNGFSFSTDVSHRDGYTFNGLGACVRDAVWHPNLVEFTVWMRVVAAPAIDRIQHLQSYGFQGRVTYLILWAEGAESSFEEAVYSIEHRMPISAYPKIPHAPVEDQRLVLSGVPGFSSSLVGLSGFLFSIDNNMEWFPGRYIKELSLDTRILSYDPAGGQMELLSDGYFSNSGPVTWRIGVDFSATYGLFQFDDPDLQFGQGEISTMGNSPTPTTILWHSFRG